MKALNGKIMVLKACSCSGHCDDILVFRPDHGQAIEYIENKACAPINKRIEAFFDGKVIVNYNELPELAKMVDESKKDIALIIFADPQYFNEEMRPKVRKAAKELEDWLKLVNEAGGHKWHTVRVTPYAIATDIIKAGPTLMNLDNEEVSEELRSQNPDRWPHHNYWHTWGSSRQGMLGLAYKNGPEAWTGIAGDTDVIKHEQLHSFGCDHSSTPNEEYRQFNCVMGVAKRTGLCLSQYGRLKMLRDEHIADVENNKRYFIVPTELKPGELRQGEIKGLFLQGNDYSIDHVLLSTRKPKSQSRLGAGFEDGMVDIDETRRSFLYTPIYRGSMMPGDTRTIQGYQIKHAGVQEGVVQLEVGNAPPQPYPQPAMPQKTDPIKTEKSGLWNDEEHVHQGLFLVVNEDDDRVTGYFYSHYPRGKKQVGLSTLASTLWFVFDGYINTDTNQVEFDILDVRNRQQRKCGHGTLQRVGNELVVYFYSDVYGRESMRLSQLTSAPTGPVEIRESGELEGYTRGQFGDVYLAIYFGHGRGEEMVWNIYIGDQRNKLRGYRVDGRYNQHFTGEIQHLEHLIQNLEHLDYDSLDDLDLVFST